MPVALRRAASVAHAGSYRVSSTLPGRHTGRILFLVPSFLLLGILFVIGVMAIPALLSQLGEMSGRPRLQMLMSLFGVGVSLIVKGTMIYSVFFLWATGGRVFAAIGKSYQLAREWSWLTGLVVLTSWIVQLPAGYLTNHSEILWSNTGPGSVFVVMLLGIFVEAVAFFYLFASTTYVALEEAGRR